MRLSTKDVAVIVGVGIAGLGVMVAALIIHRARSSSEPWVALAPKSSVIPAAAEPRKLTLKEQLDSASTLAGALETAKPHFRDSVNDLDPASAVFALWCTSRLNWHELLKLDSTMHAYVMKDSTEERGKLVCAPGQVVEIEVDRSAGVPVSIGVLADGDLNFYRFVAVRSTDGIVADKRAKFCGVVTGKVVYSNVSGGQTKAVQLVGMFDLPANVMMPPSAQSAAGRQ